MIKIEDDLFLYPGSSARSEPKGIRRAFARTPPASHRNRPFTNSLTHSWLLLPKQSSGEISEVCSQGLLRDILCLEFDKKHRDGQEIAMSTPLMAPNFLAPIIIRILGIRSSDGVGEFAAFEKAADSGYVQGLLPLLQCKVKLALHFTLNPKRTCATYFSTNYSAPTFISTARFQALSPPYMPHRLSTLQT